MTCLHRGALALGVAVAAMSACGASDSPSNAQHATASTTAVSLPPPEEASAGETTMTAPSPEAADCDVDRRTLQVAVEAYVARTGALPTSQDDLVGDDLREEITSHRLDPDGRVARRSDMPCVSPDSSPDPDEPSTVDGWLDLLGDEFVEDTGGLECASEVARILVAATAFEAREDREPVDLDELVGDLETPPELWSFDDDAETLIPADGSGCIDPNRVEPDVECETRRRILEVATETYEAMEGELPTDQRALLDTELVRELSPDFEIIGRAVTVLPGTECATLLAELGAAEPGPFTQADCDVDFRTLSVAIDTYVAATERHPDNEQQLVDAGFIRDRSRMWDVVYGDLVPADDSGCEYPVE